MTAINAYVRRDGSEAFILADSVAVKTRGDMMAAAHQSKVMTLPHSRIAFAVRGQSILKLLLLPHIEKHAGFDELAETFGTDWAPIASKFPPQFCQGAFEVICVGWSEKAQRMRAFCSQSSNGFVPKFDDLILCPDVDLSRIPLTDFAGPLTFGAAAGDLLRILRQQRSIAATTIKVDARGLIGGHAVLTTITKDAISQRVVHRWPDQIGAQFLTATQPAEQRKVTSVRSLPLHSGQGDTAAPISPRSDALLPRAALPPDGVLNT